MKNGFSYMIKACVVCFVFIFGLFNHAMAEDILIIANKEVPAEDLGPMEIKSIFLGKTVKWNNDDVIKIALLKDSGVHRQFLRKYVQRTTSQFENVWRRNFFTGKGRLPVKLKSTEDILNYLSTNKGAISYISSGEKLPDNVKVISSIPGGHTS